MRDFFISIAELKHRIGTSEAPVIFDVRRRPLFDAENTILPTARWRDHTAGDLWACALKPEIDVVIHCVHGHNVSQAAAATLRAGGINACVLEGGIEAWREASGPLILKDALPHRDEDVPSVWVTGINPQIDQLACSWLVQRFVDHDAIFLQVETEQVIAVAGELGGISYGVVDGDIAGSGENSIYATCLDRFGLAHAPLDAIAKVVRAATHGDVQSIPEAAGLRALLGGALALSGAHENDARQRVFHLFDALYAWQSQTANTERRQSAWPAIPGSVT